ncbi:hypothetical protein CVD28_17625 [Bacillus sp. M6-12]|uniref:isoprenylcysteine carboxyl methyltransferase family protein n=1 Tax=Bacillus sp. M6-12 TaxID=2054166 RepID=UPI000C78F7AA|nr:isoprenylcysteine carboxylmethyltransferase family protein [Bacillus sp. M6-12]PLS16295.1 hypothetical protein CVD28_17625 [Bacillus sp. M6-12]
MIFGGIIAIVCLQRFAELFIAKRNEKWMKQQGAIEFGTSHYRWMVAMHIGYFLSLIMEVSYLDTDLSPIWGLWLAIFLAAQAGRVWALSSLGRYWNTKIIVLPGANVVIKGPYKFIKHPNYLIVATEIIVMALLFNAFITAVLFTCLNIMMMRVRIPEEERALKSLTDYSTAFKAETHDS